jgi:hypothetical protein
MHSILAVVLGGIVAVTLYWIGAVIAFLVMRGIPMGSAGGPPTSAEIVIHLALAAVATFLGVGVTARTVKGHSRTETVALGLSLGIAALVGFTKASSGWPGWFGIAMVLSVFIATVGGLWWSRRT